MDLITRLGSQLEDSIRAQQDTLEILTAPLAAAIEAVAACLLDGGRILICGDGDSDTDAARCARRLLHGFEHPRPALAALHIAPAAAGKADDEAQARAVFALGQPGDILLAFAAEPGSSALMAALAAAAERELRCIVLVREDDELFSELPGSEDILLQLPTRSRARSEELQHFILNCLCDGIDSLLLGVEH